MLTYNIILAATTTKIRIQLAARTQEFVSSPKGFVPQLFAFYSRKRHG